MADRADAIARAREQLHSGAFLAELGRRVAYPTESQNPDSGDALRAYLDEDCSRHLQSSISLRA